MTPACSVVDGPAETATVCTVAAHAYLEADGERLAALRQNPAPAGVRIPLPPALLKHADEQTVLSLAAVLQAAASLPAGDFSSWGVLAAPRFVGRQMFITALRKFREEGAWGVSPHLIPHRSLHSVSGTISQALKIRGPNYGVGNGPLGAAEGLLAAVAMVARDPVPGVWFVMSHWSPEPREALVSGSRAAESALGLAGPRCHALALALVDGEPAEGITGLRVRRLSSQGRLRQPGFAASRRPFSLAGLAAALERNLEPGPLVFPLPGNVPMVLELVRAGRGEMER